MFEGIDPTVIYGLTALLSGLISVVGSYALKAYNDPEINFDWAYAGGLAVQVVVAIGSIVPANPTGVDFQTLYQVFLAGLGLQTIINKAVTMKRNS